MRRGRGSGDGKGVRGDRKEGEGMGKEGKWERGMERGDGNFEMRQREEENSWGGGGGGGGGEGRWEKGARKPCREGRRE